jgi:hypothetical protein
VHLDFGLYQFRLMRETTPETLIAALLGALWGSRCSTGSRTSSAYFR